MAAPALLLPSPQLESSGDILCTAIVWDGANVEHNTEVPRDSNGDYYPGIASLFVGLQQRTYREVHTVPTASTSLVLIVLLLLDGDPEGVPSSLPDLHFSST
jgi:hypothetical protein